MKVAFLTEMGFTGQIPAHHPNMRTEFAWMHALDATHYPITSYPNVSGFDFVFIIWPKGRLDLNAEGIALSNTNPKRTFNQLCSTGEVDKIIPILKENNGKVAYVQEGPGWWWEDYDLQEQIYYLNLLNQSDVIFCHNEADKKYYKHYRKPVHVMHSLIIEDLIKDIKPLPEQKIIIGGNFCRWYGGMKSYLISCMFSGHEIWAPSMHNKQSGEEQLVKHLPYLEWLDWIKVLATFKIGVHMMPTAAAGTFSLNCAYLGIPVIGNENVDTQSYCHSSTSVDPDDVEGGMVIVDKLLTLPGYYEECSYNARTKARELFIKEPWLERMVKILSTL